MRHDNPDKHLRRPAAKGRTLFCQAAPNRRRPIGRKRKRPHCRSASGGNVSSRIANHPFASGTGTMAVGCRVHPRTGRRRPAGERKRLWVVIDRFRLGNVERSRVIEALEVALRHGGGRLRVYALPAEEGGGYKRGRTRSIWIAQRVAQPTARQFRPCSHSTPPWARAETCRGFGRVID